MGRASLLVFSAEIVDYESLELLLDVQYVVGHSQPMAHHAGVFHVINGAASPVLVGHVGLVQVVQLHGDADDIVTLLLQQQGRH